MTLRVLEVLSNAVRCGAGHLMSDDRVWDAAQCAYRVARRDKASALLRRGAESTLTAVVMAVYSRVTEILHCEAAQAQSQQAPGTDNGAQSDAYSTVAGVDASDNAVAASTGVTNTAASVQPYGTPVLTRILKWLSGLVDPKTNGRAVRLAALEWINIALETGGTDLSVIPPIVTVCQAELARFLIASSRSSDLSVLALALRVIFNLFMVMKGHLKVQLEVFFVSVHLYLADSRSAMYEQRELALESLLEFCREPALMSDLYINYDW